MIERMLMRLTDPTQHATFQMVTTLVDNQREIMRRDKYSEESIDRHIENNTSYFLSEARLILPYSTPLTKLMTPSQIKIMCRFELQELIEMTVRLSIPRSYIITRYSLKKKKYIKYITNLDPTLQLFIMLSRTAHGITLEALSVILRLSYQRILAVQLAVESYLISTKGQLLDCSKFEASFE